MEQLRQEIKSEPDLAHNSTAQLTADRITLWHLALFLVFLPFGMIYSELVLISLLIHTLIQIKRKEANKILSRENLVLMGVLLLNVICLSWSPDQQEGINYILRQLAFLLFPLIFLVAGPVARSYRKRLLHVLGFTCVATLLYLYADAFRIILYYKMPVKALFTQAFLNHNFSAPISMHATYLSLYVALAAICFLQSLVREESRKKQFLYTISLLVLYAGLVQLTSRSVLISFLFITTILFPFFIPAGKKRMYFILLTLACSAATLTLIISAGSLKRRYVAELKDDLTQQSINNETIESRVTRWKVIWPVATRSLLTGQGTGSEKKLLQEAYFKNKLYNSYLHELNTHNQYLKFLLESGIPGLLLFLFTLLWGIQRALANRDIVFLSFMILVAILCFSENMLDVNKGIFFYAFFFSFFVHGSKPAKGILRFSLKEPA